MIEIRPGFNWYLEINKFSNVIATETNIDFLGYLPNDFNISLEKIIYWPKYTVDYFTDPKQVE